MRLLRRRGLRGRVSLRTYLFVILATVSVVVASLGSFLAVGDFRSARLEAGRDTGFQARLAAAAIASAVEQNVNELLTSFSNPAAVQLITELKANPAKCVGAVSGGGLGPFPDGEAHLADPSGRIFCTSAKHAPTNATLAGLPWFAHLTADPVTTPPFLDPIDGKMAVAAAALVEKNGRPWIAVVSTLAFDSLPASLSSTYGGRLAASFTIVDTKSRTILAGATTAIGDWPGGAFGGTVHALSRTGVDGVKRIYSSAPVAGTGWMLYSGVRESRALAAARRNLTHEGALALAAIIVLLLLGLAVNRQIVHPMRRLQGAVEQAGRDVTPAPLSVEGPSEIARLVEEFNAMIAARTRSEARLLHHALHDGLTGLPNRALLIDRTTKALERSARSGLLTAVLFADLDRFRVLNDGLGHANGDAVLRQIARRLADVVRPGDTVARMNGDEFVVLCEDLTSETQAATIAERIGDAVSEPINLDGTTVSVTASIGIAIAHGGETADDLLRDADVATRRAKERGKARHEFFDASLRSRALSRVQIENDLRSAIEHRELVVHYQPEIDVTSGAVVGVEALVRWQHPESGLQLPMSFIPVAEETGLIVPLGRFVLEEACRQAAAWREAGTPVRVSVNLSPKQLVDRDLPRQVAGVLDASGLPAELLCLEITEGTLMDDATPISTLDRLQELGVSISIDDFGTGYSSLAYLQRFPIDQLKIDRAFVRAMGTSTALVAAVVGLARALGLMTVAEGVEDQRELDTLRALGCDAAQGFFIMRPGPADVVGAFLGESLVRVGA